MPVPEELAPPPFQPSSCAGFVEPGVVFAFHAGEEVGAVGRLGDGEEFAVDALVFPCLDAVDERVEGEAGNGGVEDLEVAAAAGRDEVVEAGALDVLGFDEVEDGVEVLDVVAGQREAQSGFLAGGVAVAEAIDGGLEGTGFAAEVVVDFPDAVEGNADVGDGEFLEPPGHVGRDAGAIGGNRDFQAQAGGQFKQVVEMRVDGRLAAREQQSGDAVGGDVADHGFHLRPVQLARVGFGFGVAVAVDAAQVAGARDVPDDNRAAGAGGFGAQPPRP